VHLYGYIYTRIHIQGRSSIQEWTQKKRETDRRRHSHFSSGLATTADTHIDIDTHRDVDRERDKHIDVDTHIDVDRERDTHVNVNTRIDRRRERQTHTHSFLVRPGDDS